MKYKRAAERNGDDGNGSGVWDYISHHSNMKRVHRLGYCDGTPSTTREEFDERMQQNGPNQAYEDGWDSPRAERDKEMLERNRERVEEFGEKYHDDGHESKEAAEECYAEYVWDMQTEVVDDPAEHELHDLDDVTANSRTPECEHDDCDQLMQGPTVELELYMAPRWFFCGTHCTEDIIRDRIRSYVSGKSIQM